MRIPKIRTIGLLSAWILVCIGFAVGNNNELSLKETQEGVQTSNPVSKERERWSKRILKHDASWFGTGEARAIADSVLQYQSPQGGWPKSTDLAQPPLTLEEIPQPGSGRANSLDNDATTVPMQFFARVVFATGEPRYILSFEHGIEYLLAAQYPSGGWPQFWPLRGDKYYSRITYNDGAMIQVMELLSAVVEGKAPFNFVNLDQRKRAFVAIERGLECILKTQIRQNGVLTGWCAQHDENSMKPAWARAYEPPSLSGGESVGIVRYLISIEDPSEEVVAAIEGAVAWLKEVEMKGVRLEGVRREDGRLERWLVDEPNGSKLWARFYELETNRPLYLDRDSVFRYDFSEIGYERRSGYGYHGDWAVSLLEKDYPNWISKNKTH